jgi:WD40 repeat protein
VMSSRQRSYDEGRAAAYSASGDKILKRWDLHSLLRQASSPSSSSADSGGRARVVTATDRVTGLKGLVGGAAGGLSVTTTSLRPDAAAAMTCTHSVRAHDKDVNCTAIAPNDAIVATGSQDKTIKLWKADTLGPVATLRGHKRGTSANPPSLPSCSVLLFLFLFLCAASGAGPSVLFCLRDDGISMGISLTPDE